MSESLTESWQMVTRMMPNLDVVRAVIAAVCLLAALGVVLPDGRPHGARRRVLATLLGFAGLALLWGSVPAPGGLTVTHAQAATAESGPPLSAMTTGPAAIPPTALQAAVAAGLNPPGTAMRRDLRSPRASADSRGAAMQRRVPTILPAVRLPR